MNIGQYVKVPLVLGVAFFLVMSCSDDQTDTVEQRTHNTSNQENEKSITKPEQVVNSIELASLPDTINLDPCQLLTKEELDTIGLPTAQYHSQFGSSRQIPNHSPITPFIACKWRSVDEGTPVGWIQIQHIEGDITPQDDERFGLGEVSWKGSFSGRDQLVVKTGNRLVMVTTQIPYNDRSEMESNIWIAEKVLSRLGTISEETQPKTANAELVGGPSLDICAASQPAKPYHLLQGNTAWAIPRFDINHTPSMKERPQEDGVACTYSSNRRGHVIVSYLGKDGVKRWNSHFEKNGTQDTLEQYDVFRERKRLYIPLNQGALMVEAQSIRLPDEEITEKFNEIALEVLSNL